MAKRKNVIPNRELADVHQEVEVKSKPMSLREVVTKHLDKYECLSDSLAENKLCYLNYYYPGGRVEFALQDRFQTVDKFYPYAKGGPLFIDEPSQVELQEKRIAAGYETKKAVMKKLGHRYLLITPNMKELDCREAIA